VENPDGATVVTVSTFFFLAQRARKVSLAVKRSIAITLGCSLRVSDRENEID